MALFLSNHGNPFDLAKFPKHLTQKVLVPSVKQWVLLKAPLAQNTSKKSPSTFCIWKTFQDHPTKFQKDTGKVKQFHSK